jgi:cation:H+ antiporter
VSEWVPSGARAGLGGLAPWQLRLAVAAACTVPGLLVRFTGGGASPTVALVAYGAAVVAAAFMLAWACEAAQVDFASGLVVSVVAFVAILPEFIVELHFAYSGHAEYVTANLTGASRLLLGFSIAMPVALGLLPVSRQPRRLGPIVLDPSHRLDLAILGLSSLWALRGVVRGQLTLLDSAVLISLYLLYLRRAASAGGESAPPMGVAESLAGLPKAQRHRWILGLMLFAALVILLTAVPFGDAVLGTGALVGISPYLVLHWLVPVATEMPELVVAVVLLLHGRGGQSVAVLLAGAVSQYTLALGSLPLAYVVGAGTGPLPLQPREQIELLLTTGVALYAVAALVTLRLSRADASLMFVLFAAQFLLPTGYTRLAIAAVFTMLAVDVLISERRQLRSLARALRPAASA